MADENVYRIVSGNTVTVVSGANVYQAAAKVGTTPTDPDTSIRSLSTGCYQPTLQEAKDKYEKDPVSDFGYKAPEPDKDRDTTPSTIRDTTPSKTTTKKVEPIPFQPATITKYQFKLNDGTVKSFEAMTTDEAEHAVLQWKADIDTLSIVGTRELSQYEIRQNLSGAASRSGMDYARALIKYDQVEGVVPVRDGKTREAMLISEADWNALSPDYQNIVTTKGLDALNTTIYDSLPETYQQLADKEDLTAAITAYNADVERSNEIVDRLKPYRDGSNYDIVTPYQLGIVTADDLKVAGFDTKDVKGVAAYVTKLSAFVDRWDKQARRGSFLTSKIMTQGQLNDFNNALTETGMIKKYKLGGWSAEFFFAQPNVVADKWNKDFTLEDKYNVAESYAAYPAPAKLLSSTYRGMISEAPEMAPAARFVKQFTLGGASATIKPFVKEQIKDNLQVMLEPYKEDGGYNITAYLDDFPEDAALLARGGIEVKELEKALDGKKVVAEVKGASRKDWAVAGLIVTAIGAGGASLLVTQPAKSGLIAVSGLSQLGLGTYATVDTVKYWSQMDTTQRAIAISFDVFLLTSGFIATKGGLTRFKAEGGWLKIRNKVMYNYHASRNIIKKILPSSKKAEWILSDIARAIRTGDTKLLKAAAKQLQLEAAKMPKQLRDPLIKRAKLLQAAPDDYIKLGDKKKTPQDLINAIEGNDAFIRNAERALRRIKDPKRYNSVREALTKAMTDREKLITRVKTKEATRVTPLERVIWDRQAGKYVPAKPQTTALTKVATKPATVKAPRPVKSRFKLLQLGKKVRDLIRKKEIDKRKLAALIAAMAEPKPQPKPQPAWSPSDAARHFGVSIWDLSRAIRKLPKGVQEEIALTSPQWAIIVKTKGATITETQTILARNLQKAQQADKPEQKPAPLAATKPQLQPAVALQTQTTTKTKTKAKAKLTKEQALGLYPFFNIPTDVKTRYKRRRRLGAGEDEADITRQLPRDKKGIITFKQGLFYITGFPPYRTQDFIYTKKRPHYAETGKGRRSPQRTLKAVGGKVPHIVTLHMGIVTAKVKGGDILTYAPRSRSGRRSGKRRRGRIVY